MKGFPRISTAAKIQDTYLVCVNCYSVWRDDLGLPAALSCPTCWNAGQPMWSLFRIIGLKKLEKQMKDRLALDSHWQSMIPRDKLARMKKAYRRFRRQVRQEQQERRNRRGGGHGHRQAN